MKNEEVKLPDYMDGIKQIAKQMAITAEYSYEDKPEELAKIAFKLLKLSDDKTKKELQEVSEFIQWLYRDKSQLRDEYEKKSKAINDWYDRVLYSERDRQELELDRQAKAKQAEAEAKK